VKIVTLHILKEWIAWFLGSLFFLMGTIFLFILVEDFNRVFPSGQVNFSDLGKWAVEYLPWLIPICSLLSSMFTLAYLKKRGEWTAIQSTGISSIQALGGIILLGVFISLGCGWLSSVHITEVDDDQFSQNRPLRMKIGNERIWYFKDFNSSSLCGSQVQLFCYGDNGEDVMRIRAERAHWSAENGWSFENGRFLGFYGIGGLPVLSKNEQSIIWERISSENNVSLADKFLKSPGFNKSFKNLTVVEIKDDPRPHMLLLQKPNKLNLAQLQRVLGDFPDSEDPQLAPYRLRKAQLWCMSPACLIGLLFGLALGRSPISTSPGKIGGVAILGSIGFYSVRTLFDSLGEKMIVLPEIAAGMPYLLTILVMIFIWFIDHRK
jgi:lipopolysaccharide export LptBFGC system permease protein LptF